MPGVCVIVNDKHVGSDLFIKRGRGLFCFDLGGRYVSLWKVHPDCSAGPKLAFDPHSAACLACNAVNLTKAKTRALADTLRFGVLAVTQAMLPLIRLSASGRVVNVSSGVGSMTLNSEPDFPFRPYYGVTYSASKTALNAITLALAIELESTGIKVRAVGPSYTATAINDFQGTDSVEVGSRPIVLAALDTESLTGSFTGPDGAYPW